MSTPLILTNPFASEPIIVADVEPDMPSDLLMETAYMEKLGLSRALFPVYRSLEKVKKHLELSAATITDASQLHHMQQQLVMLETNNKKNGIWGGKLSSGDIPTGQAVLNDLLERTHAVEAAIAARLPAEENHHHLHAAGYAKTAAMIGEVEREKHEAGPLAPGEHVAIGADPSTAAGQSSHMSWFDSASFLIPGESATEFSPNSYGGSVYKPEYAKTAEVISESEMEKHVHGRLENESQIAKRHDY